MDNLCHSLAGAAFAQAGFARRLPRATLLAVVAANIPDLDALTYLFSDAPTAVAFRRGWTHGVPALIVWAIALAWAFALWQRARPSPAAKPATLNSPSMRDYLPLAAIAVVSHPLLDLMNTYGVRLLMPLSDRWFYGDTLFIVDLMLIGLLGAGALASARMLSNGSRRAEWPARAALALGLAYIGGMKGLSVAARNAAAERFAVTATGPLDLMVAPQPASWRTRDVLVRRGEAFEWSRWTVAGAGGLHAEDQGTVTSGADSSTIAAVRSTSDGTKFLRWSRFPYFVPGTGADAGTIFVGDARYSSGTEESWAGVRVRPIAQEAPASR